MANSNTPAVKKSFLGSLKAFPGKVVKGFSSMYHELRKVSWPTRKQLLNYTFAVLVFMFFMGIIISLLDTVSVQLVNLIS